MTMNGTLKSYVRAMRIRELTICLDQLGLDKRGRKQELQARLFAYFGEASPAAGRGVVPPHEQWRLDHAVRLVTSVYCKMKGLPDPAGVSGPQPCSIAAYAAEPDMPGPAALANGHSAPNGRIAAASCLSKTHARPPPSNAADRSIIRCVCGSNIDRGIMIQCEGEGCGVWQHCGCVGVAEFAAPAHFWCEICRLARADPFWVAVGPPLFPPVRLSAPALLGRPPPAKYSEEVAQVSERAFLLQPPHLDLLRTTHQLRAAAVALPDDVPFRIHWPRQADLRVNSLQYRLYARSPAVKLGAQARDEAASLGVLCFPGKNRIALSARDSRPFALVVQLCARRSVAEVRALMAPAETLEAGLARVRQQAGGGGAGSEDDDIVVGSTVLSLRCPLSGSRITAPARFRPVGGLAAFDLEAFLALAQRARKWQCPHSMRALSVHDLQRDAFLERILARLQKHPEVMEVELSAAGQWRPANLGGPWNSVFDDIARPLTMRALSSVKTEPAVDGSGRGGPGPASPSGRGRANAADTSEDEVSEAHGAQGAELRAAAAAAAAVPTRPRSPIDLISLLSSDSDEAPGGPADHAAGTQRRDAPLRPWAPPWSPTGAPPGARDASGSGLGMEGQRPEAGFSGQGREAAGARTDSSGRVPDYSAQHVREDGRGAGVPGGLQAAFEDWRQQQQGTGWAGASGLSRGLSQPPPLQPQQMPDPLTACPLQRGVTAGPSAGRSVLTPIRTPQAALAMSAGQAVIYATLPPLAASTPLNMGGPFASHGMQPSQQLPQQQGQQLPAFRLAWRPHPGVAGGAGPPPPPAPYPRWYAHRMPGGAGGSRLAPHSSGAGGRPSGSGPVEGSGETQGPLPRMSPSEVQCPPPWMPHAPPLQPSAPAPAPPVPAQNHDRQAAAGDELRRGQGPTPSGIGRLAGPASTASERPFHFGSANRADGTDSPAMEDWLDELLAQEAERAHASGWHSNGSGSQDAARYDIVELDME